MKYLVIIEKAGRNYSAYVPDLPGCVAVGDTLKETEKMIGEAMGIHIMGMREDGEKIPKPSKFEEVEVKKYTVREFDAMLTPLGRKLKEQQAAAKKTLKPAGKRT